MADFEEALNALLSDPAAMEQIADLAGRLGGAAPPPPEEGDGAAAAPPPPFDADQLGQLGRLMELVQTCGRTDAQSAALLAALRPFLRDERQAKLDQAVRLAGLSRAAREAYRLWKGGELHL